MSAPPILDEQQDAKPVMGLKARDYLRAIAPCIVLFWLAMALIGPWIAPYDSSAIQNADIFEGMSWKFLLGTDYFGRDLLSRILAGARYTVGIALIATLLSAGTGVLSAADSSTAKTINLPEQALNFNMGTIVGSFATVAKLLDEAATVPGTKGLMLTFDDFVEGIETFGKHIQPLMASRASRLKSAA
jgi:alkanesulfonate monooxygenase SsuD/methylene tetrahydromethanopterin reductase-like flavin-dependent oxidoreductase (luciferase family)